VWDAHLDRRQIATELSADAYEETAAAINSVPGSVPVTDAGNHIGPLPRLRDELESWRDRVERRERVVLLRPLPDLDFRKRRIFAWIVANSFGEPLVQNSQGDQLVAVYARPGTKRVADGARHHQTREGGGPHTDNVNIPEPWEYLVFSCIRPARIGGESILIDGVAVHERLLAVPDALDILRQPFWWEYRGISDRLYQAPVITYDGRGEPRFRYMRRYLESAHHRAGEPLTAEQVWALDVLDAVLDLSELQFRTTLEQGEVLITSDSQVLHARTSFCDPRPGAPQDVDAAAVGSCRFFDRVWVRKDRR
jgi:alpha-ketoglutarate-dependent taurine dioxygenase